MAPMPYQSENQTMSPQGLLGHLPPELRLIIWGFLLFENQESTPKSISAISKCNRFLYNEVSYYLYRQIRHIILLKPTHKAAWGIEIEYGNQVHEWTFKQESTLQKYIHTFLRVHANASSRPNVRIIIYRSCEADRSRIVCMWKNVNELVEVLKQKDSDSSTHHWHSHPTLHILLCGNWVFNERPRHSCRGIDAGYLSRHPLYRTSPDDHDIVAMPFLQLKAFSIDFQLPAQLSSLISQDPERDQNPYSIPYRILNGIRDDVCFSEEKLQKLMAHTACWMDRVFYFSPGPTGYLLRQDLKEKLKAQASSQNKEDRSSKSPSRIKKMIPEDSEDSGHEDCPSLSHKHTTKSYKYPPKKRKGPKVFSDEFWFCLVTLCLAILLDVLSRRLD